jgi:ABC-2 type transport system ATP-binding protein
MTSDLTSEILVARDLKKRFGARVALGGISFSMRRGEVLGYVGPNGAGKTTTLRVVTGTEGAFKGELSVRGLPMPKHRVEVYRYLGYMPQSVAFGGWRTAGETLHLLGCLSGVAPSSLARKVPEALDWVGLAKEEKTPVRTFSGGMRQRLGLAQAILHEPELLVLDEPFNHLDPAGRVHLKQLLAELNRRGVSVLFSSHILADVEEVVDRLAVLQGGRLHFIGTPSELRARWASAREVEIASSGGTGALDLVRSASGVAEALLQDDGSLLLRVADGEEAEAVTTRALASLIGGGFSIRSVRPLVPSLEEIISRLGGVEVPPCS